GPIRAARRRPRGSRSGRRRGLASCRPSCPVGESVEDFDLGRMRATRRGNQGTSEGNVSRPGSRLYPDAEPAIESGCCNAEQSRRRERQANGEFDGNREGLQIVRLVSFLYLGFEFLPPVPRLPASPRVPSVTATDQDEAHGGEDHDEQGEGPRDPEGEIREGQGG